jgi:signal transduction histidine kinase
VVNESNRVVRGFRNSLTASIAHELNQPLGAILINSETAELILKSPSPNLAELRELMTDIRRDDQRASNVLQRLRGMLKKTPSEIKDVDLNEIASESIQLLSSLSIAREVELSGTVSPTSLPVRGDPVQLQQVLVNLIVNAMDAMSKTPRAGRKVTVYAAREDKFAEVSVSDTGHGIPSENIKKVFEPFFTTKAYGMGIGLSIARTIVQAHNGRIWAENNADGGAVFHISLPRSA